MTGNMLRVAIIGAGRIGKVHAQAIASHPRAELVVVSDPFGTAAEDLSAAHGARAVKDAEAVFADSDVDAVIIGSPTPLHAQQVLAATRAGKAVLCEKPVASSVAEARELEAELAGFDHPPVMVGFQRRYDPSIKRARDLVADGEIGRVEQMTIQSRDPAAPPASYIAQSGGIFKDCTRGSYDLTHLWLIDKSVDPTKTEVTGTEATLAYDVVVTYDGFATSDHVLTGTITVENDNAWARTFTVEDVFEGQTCDVADAPRTVPAYGTVTLEYTCDLDDDDDFTPGDDDVNKATVKAENLTGDTDTVTAEADVDWAVTEYQNPVTVTDEFRDAAAVELGTITVGTDVTEKGDTVTYSYEKTVELESGECVTVRNVAKVNDGDDVIVEDDATSELCAEADLVVTKTAEGSATVQYLWEIEKKAVKTDFGILKPGDVVWAEYVVTVTPSGYEITEAALEGAFTITNPNAYKAVEVEITDVVSDGAWECTFDGDAVTIDAGATKVVTYTCSLGDDDDDEWLDGEGTNTVTVSWTNADGETSSVEYTVDYTLDVTELDKVVTIKDKFADRAETELGTAEWVEDEVTEFTYKTGMLIGSTPGKFKVDNVAWIVETGQDDDETVTFEVPKPPKKPKPGPPKTGVGYAPTAPTGLVPLAVFREEDER